MQRRANKEITLNGRKIKYAVRANGRSKKLKIVLYREGRMVVACPFFLSQKEVENFLFQNAGWILGKMDRFKNRPLPLILKGTKKDYRKFKNRALKMVQEKLSAFNARYRFKINRVCVRNQKTRWGSCSAKGNLNFNWRIVLLPENLCDYIIVHELCHLKEMNHSANFWFLVSLSCPDWVQARKQLAEIF